jgi:hypothetical protein
MLGQTRGYKRLLLVTDGIATAGHTEVKELRAALAAARTQLQRADVMLVGGIHDEAGMKQLVRGTLPQDGVVLDGAQAASEIARRLARTTVSGVSVAVPGAKWVWPRRLDGVQPGDDVLVFVDLPPSALPAGQPLTVKLGGPLTQSASVKLTPVKRPLLQRAWVEARIAHLQAQRQSGTIDPDLGAALKKQIVELSIKHRVLSDFTALLVLETERDYRRYNINRSALSDILVVGPGGIELRQRTSGNARSLCPAFKHGCNLQLYQFSIYQITDYHRHYADSNAYLCESGNTGSLWF